MEIKEICADCQEALSLPNEPFLQDGRVILLFDGCHWDYRIERFPPELVTENCFPDEHYQLDQMGEGFCGLAAYADGECAGYALLYTQWNRWLYLDNLLVLKKYRRAGIGTALINASMELANRMNKIGIHLVCQDNNLQAMRFYFANGFEIGGVNQLVYEGTKQEGKTDIFLYKRNQA